jgi:hypothetical protein
VTESCHVRRCDSSGVIKSRHVRQCDSGHVVGTMPRWSLVAPVQLA